MSPSLATWAEGWLLGLWVHGETGVPPIAERGRAWSEFVKLCPFCRG